MRLGLLLIISCNAFCLNVWAAHGEFLEGRATMEGAYQIKCLPNALVSGLLPDQLSLVPTSLCGEGLHPVLFFFGVQNNLRSVTSLGTFPLVESYNETVMLVLSVGLRGTTERFIYPSQMKVNSLTAYLFAKPYGGLNKHMARISRSRDTFESYDRHQNTLQAKANWTILNNGSVDANFALLQPYFGDRIVALNHFYFNCFAFDWNFQMSRVQSARMSFSLGDTYVGSAFRGNYDDGLTLTDSALGAFFASSDWTMGLPGACYFRSLSSFAFGALVFTSGAGAENTSVNAARLIEAQKRMAELVAHPPTVKGPNCFNTSLLVLGATNDVTYTDGQDVENFIAGRDFVTPGLHPTSTGWRAFATS